MLVQTLLYSLSFALIFSLLLTYGFKRKGPGPANGLLFYFVIIFMFSWSVGAWLIPFGPSHWDIPWAGYLILAFVIMLLLGAVIPKSDQPKPKSEESTLSDYELFEKKAATYPLGFTYGFFFWIMIVALFFIAIMKIFYQVT
jgi:hypothetical protein